MRKPLIYASCAILGLAIFVNQQFSEEEIPAAQEVLTSAQVYSRTEIISLPNEAKQLLIAGNERYITGKTLSKDLSLTRRNELLKNGQHPFAVVISCSDSRVPPELLFDQALGDLFVIRVAGNVVTPVELGSVEYAVEHLRTPLVVVLGHEECGAVTAAVQNEGAHGNIAEIIKIIKPAVDEAKATGTNDTNLVDKSVDININNTIEDILKSPIIKERVESNQVNIIGIKYDLDQGNIKYVD